MSVREHDYEPVRGLPERLPPGEEILWQGAPDWRVLARRAFHTRKVAAYFGLLLAWRGLTVWYDGEPFAAFTAGAVWLVPMALAAVVILTGLAWLHARATIYTITSRRVVMRFGVALPMTINLPFKVVEDVLLKTFPDGSGDVALKLGGEDRVSYFHLWPHVRRWYIFDAQPMFRGIPDAAAVAQRLGAAITAAGEAATASARPIEASATEARAHLAAAS